MSNTTPAGAGMQQWTVEDDTEATIKPCPKCGGKAVLEGTWNDEIVCNECGLWSGEDADSLEDAIEWWNEQPLVERLTTERDALAAELAAVRACYVSCTDINMPALEAEIERLRAEPRYVPVEDGFKLADKTDWKLSTGILPDGDWWLCIRGTDEDGNNHAAEYYLSADYRLCRLVSGQDTQPGDGQEQRVMAQQLPDDVRATIEAALRTQRKAARDGVYLADTAHLACDDIVDYYIALEEKYDTALSWLTAQHAAQPPSVQPADNVCRCNCAPCSYCDCKLEA